MPHCRYKRGGLFKRFFSLVATMAALIPKINEGSAIPDRPHWVKWHYICDGDKISLICSVWGFLNPER